MKEGISIKGIVDLYISEKVDNEWVQTQHIKQNQILNNMLNHIVKLLGASETQNITKITFGTGLEDTNRTDTSAVMLNTFTKDLNVGGITYPEYNSVKFAFSLLSAEHNGFDITEYALALTNETIVCRIKRGVVKKTADIRIDGTWEIILDII